MSSLKAKNKLLQWLASRYLIRKLVDKDRVIDLFKDEFGKPYIEGASFKLSISHCREYAAAILAYNDCGIDIETIDENELSQL